MGGLAAIFQGSEYASQAKVTAAYMIHREHLTDLTLGYRNHEGEYVCEKSKKRMGLKMPELHCPSTS